SPYARAVRRSRARTQHRPTRGTAHVRGDRGRDPLVPELRVARARGAEEGQLERLPADRELDRVARLRVAVLVREHLLRARARRRAPAPRPPALARFGPDAALRAHQAPSADDRPAPEAPGRRRAHGRGLSYRAVVTAHSARKARGRAKRTGEWDPSRLCRLGSGIPRWRAGSRASVAARRARWRKRSCTFTRSSTSSGPGRRPTSGTRRFWVSVGRTVDRRSSGRFSSRD